MAAPTLDKCGRGGCQIPAPGTATRALPGGGLVVSAGEKMPSTPRLAWAVRARVLDTVALPRPARGLEGPRPVFSSTISAAAAALPARAVAAGRGCAAR